VSVTVAVQLVADVSVSVEGPATTRSQMIALGRDGGQRPIQIEVVGLKSRQE
jgi:hypothetical protein